MFGISLSHILLGFLILLVFGPSRIPLLGRYFGKAVKNYKDQTSGVLEAEYKKLGLTDDEKKRS